MYDALNDGQAHAGTFVFLGAMQPLEHAEELVDVLYIKARAIVFDEIDVLTRAVAAGPASDLDSGYISSSGKLKGVVQQVDEDLLDNAGSA